jgi:hypothetical protein
VCFEEETTRWRIKRLWFVTCLAMSAALLAMKAKCWGLALKNLKKV